MKADVQNIEAKSAGSVELSDAIFGLEPRQDILHRMVVWQLNKRQAGTHKTKGRAEINRTGKKLGKQKGGGGARHGSRRSGIFIGGGKSFGPVVRSHATDLPKKVRALALRHALSAKVKASELIVLEDANLAAGKTKALKEVFAKLGVENALIIDGAVLNENFAMAARNIINIDVLPVQGINVYDILRRKKLVLTKAAVEALEARFK
jgi:large subunit ribosomal protein L4